MISTYVIDKTGKYLDVCPSVTDAFIQHARTSRTLRDQLAAHYGITADAAQSLLDATDGITNDIHAADIAHATHHADKEDYS